MGVIGVFVGFAYGLVAAFNPLIYVGFLVLGGASFLAMMMMSWAVEFGHVRNKFVAAGFGALAGAIAVYASWVGWLWIILGELPDGESAFNPLVQISAVLFFLEEGAWSVSDFTPTGLVLLLIWGIEAVALMAGPVLGAWMQAGEPYCEHTANWFEQVFDGLVLGDAPDATVRSVVEQGRVGELATMPDPTGNSWIKAKLVAVDGPPRRAALTLTRVTRTQDNKGNDSDSEAAVVTHLILAGPLAELTAQLPEHLAARRAAPAPEG